MHQLFWMLAMGMPMVGLVHIAVGSFLALQAYYGSTFVDGTGAVVGVGLLRNLGGIMSGLIFAGILAARMIPELRMISRHAAARRSRARGAFFRISARQPRCVRTRASRRDRFERRTGFSAALPNHRGGDRLRTSFALGNHRRHRGRLEGGRVLDGTLDRDVLHDDAQDDVVPRCDEFDCQRRSLRRLAGGDLLAPSRACAKPGAKKTETPPIETRSMESRIRRTGSSRPPCSVPVFRAACLSMVAILIMNSSWFILVYHAVPFYGPTLLPQP